MRDQFEGTEISNIAENTISVFFFHNRNVLKKVIGQIFKKKEDTMKILPNIIILSSLLLNDVLLLTKYKQNYKQQIQK